MVEVGHDRAALGVRLWYGFYGATLESDAAFKGKVDELSRELGERGKAC